MLAFGKIPALLVLAFSVSWAAAPSFSGEPNLSVVLHVPSPLRVGGIYEAELHVRSVTFIPDAYVKLSLPHALRVVSGRTDFRGSLPANTDFVLQATFEVVGVPAAPVSGKALAYFGKSRSMFGKGQTLYCKVVDGVIVLSDKSPAAEEDAQLEAEVNAVGLGEREHTAWLGRRLQQRRDRAVLREQLDGPKFPLPLVPSTLLPENASVQGLLQRGGVAGYHFNGHAGDRIWITVESEQFDPRLLVVRSDGAVVAEDDDGAGGLNARIPSEGVFELSSTDTYWLVIRAHGESEGGEYGLKVENFTHLEPARGSVLPASKQDPSRSAGPHTADVQLTGRVLYNSPSGAAPVRLALAGLFADVPFDVDPVIATSQTDANGDVSFRVPEAHRSKTLYVVVYTQDAAARLAAVRDPLLGLDFVHSAEMTSRFTLPAASSVTFGSWNLAGTGLNAPFLVFDAAVEGYLIATEVLRFTPSTVKVSYPARDQYLQLFSDPKDRDAHYIAGEIVLSQSYQNSPDVVLHEYGHFIADLARFDQSRGGPHTFGTRAEPRLAWSEGWATFFAIAGQNARGNRAKTRMTSAHPEHPFDFSLEEGHNPSVINESEAGDDNEGSVVFVLWDLFDDLRDYLPVARSVDSVALGLKPIFDVARNGARFTYGTVPLDLYSIAYLETFYDGLFQQRSFGADQITAIQGVFRDQYIRWEVPPAPPVGLKFGWKGSAIALQWQPGSPNSVAYVIEQKLPGQAEFKLLGSSGSAEYVLGSVVIGATFQVTAYSDYTARFRALLPSGPSQQITYSAPPPPSATIAVSKTQLKFALDVSGPSTASDAVNVTNTGGGTLLWSAVSGAPWLSVSPPSGTAPSTVTVTVNRASLGVGTYAGTITVSSPGLASQTIQVTLVVTAVVQLGVAPSAVVFTCEAGGTAPGPKTVFLAASGGAAVAFAVSVKTDSGGNWLTANPMSGFTAATLTLSVNPSGLAPGQYTGTVTVASGGAANSPLAIPVTLTVSAPVPKVTITSVVNAASFESGMVPGGLATLFGKSLSPISGIEFPGGATSYKGVSVTVEGHQVPLLAVTNIGGQEQVNFQVPFDLGAPAMARVEVNNNGSIATIGNVPVLRVQPGIFEWAPQWSSTKYAAAVKVDGSVVSPSNPVSRGDAVSLFLTGMGPVLPILQTGQIGPADPLAVTYLQPVVAVGGLGAQVLFSGYAPGFLGLYQINIVIPDAAPTGVVSLEVVVEGARSQSSLIPVQ